MVSRELVFTGAAGFFAILFIVEPLAVWLFGTLDAADVKDLTDASFSDASLHQTVPFLQLPVSWVRAARYGYTQPIE